MRISRTRKKSYKKRFIISIITLLLTVSCFVSVSYAWFTNSAYVSGNKVFAGNLMVDVLISEEDLEANLVKTGVIEDGGNIPDDLNSFKYVRELDNDDTETYYYASRIPSKVNEKDIDTSILHVENVEPGQAIRVKVNIVNSGDLALKAAGALRVDDSFTGLETLVNKNKLDSTKFDVNGIPNSFNPTNGIPDSSNKSGYASTDQDTFFFNTLLNIQTEEVINVEEADITIQDNEGKNRFFKDKGGRLKDILCVYLLEDVGNGDLNFNRETSDFDFNKLKDDPRFFGTLKQFEFMLTYGANPTENNIKEYDSYFSGSIELNAHGDYKSRLESDYLRYLDYASGYCLPQAEMKDTDNKIPSEGKSVEVKGADGEVLYTRKGVSEIETINFLLYMPLEAGDEYQNASISLSLGATASQVEYEKDDTGYMIYDMSEHNNSHISNTCSIKYIGIGNIEKIIEVEPGTVINFNAGTHGSYVTSPDPVTVKDNNKVYDFTDSKYVPEGNGDYSFDGFEFDSLTSTLTATYVIVRKGDLISLPNDETGRQYKVLSVNGNEAKLLAMYSIGTTYYNDTLKYDDIEDFHDVEPYSESKLQITLNNFYENDLDNTIKTAIVKKTIYQDVIWNVTSTIDFQDDDIFSIHGFPPNPSDPVRYRYLGKIEVGEGYIYPLSVSDLVDYLGREIYSTQLNELLFGTTEAVSEKFWLITANNYSHNINYVYGDGGYFTGCFANTYELDVRPMFVVDLTKINCEKVTE